MIRNTVWALLIAGSCWAGDGKSIKDDLIELEKTLAAAVLAADIDTLNRIYADDFVFTHSTGKVESKPTWIEGIRSKINPYSERRVDQIEVEVHGDVAVTSGRIYAKTKSKDPRWGEYFIWYLRVYAVRDGRWQLLSHRSIRDERVPKAT